MSAGRPPRRRAGALCAVLALLWAAGARAQPCPTGDAVRGAPRPAACREPERLRPYEPDRERPGQTPGFVDLGNGTEVRIGGRVRLEHDVRR